MAQTKGSNRHTLNHLLITYQQQQKLYLQQLHSAIPETNQRMRRNKNESR